MRESKCDQSEQKVCSRMKLYMLVSLLTYMSKQGFKDLYKLGRNRVAPIGGSNL